ncbi:MAG: M28 family metallopeptidase [Leeuwenhoekiella sp.]
MKRLLLTSALLGSLFFLKCGPTNNHSEKNIADANPMDYAKTITPEELKDLLYTYASDEFEGRETGEPGQKKAVAFLKDFYVKHNIPSPLDTTYFQTVPESFFAAGSGIKASENVLAFIKGSTKPDEIVIVSAHLDHVGVRADGDVYNGADDDGSGTVAVLQIADAFNEALKKGYRPQRSILFLHVTGEEKGLYGSRYYAEHPVFPLKNTVVDLNIDMIGRQDFDHPNDDNYVYLIGSSMLSTELHDISEEVNKNSVNLELDYKYDAPDDPNRFYYRSDHYNFAKNGVPVIFYFNGVHEDYHKVTDSPDKINYPLLAKRAKLVFMTAWELANREDRIKLNK